MAHQPRRVPARHHGRDLRRDRRERGDHVQFTGGQVRGPEQRRRLPHRPGPGADHAGHADGARRRGLVEGPVLADGAGHAVSRRQDLGSEVARRLEQDPSQAFPGRASDHRRRERALGSRQPADPHPALRRGRPLSVQRRGRGRSGQPREETHGHLLEPQDRAGLDPDDPGREPDRDRLCRERPAPVLGAVPGLRRASGSGLGSGALGERRRRAQAGDGEVSLRRLRRALVGRAALERDPPRRVAGPGAVQGHRRVPPERDLLVLGAARGDGARVPLGAGRRRRGDEDLRQHLARRDLDGIGRSAGLAAAGGPARGMGTPEPCPGAGCS